MEQSSYRVLTAKMTVICVLAACLFPGAGYDSVLATAFGLPGLRLRPGAKVPSGSAFSQAGKLLGEQVMKRIFELDAAVADADLGIGLLRKGLEVTAIDGTTMELARNDVLDGESGTPSEGARPLLRVTAHVRTATFRWAGAAAGGYHDGENALAGQLEDSFRPGMLNLAGRGFFSMHRRIRFPGTGADLAWRVKNGAKSVPLKTLRTLPDGSELVILHESDGMRTRRRKETGDPRAERLPDTAARLVTFTVTATTRSGRTKTTRMRVLTALLGQEAWALLLIHNIVATAAARAAGPAGAQLTGHVGSGWRVDDLAEAETGEPRELPADPGWVAHHGPDVDVLEELGGTWIGRSSARPLACSIRVGWPSTIAVFPASSWRRAVT